MTKAVFFVAIAFGALQLRNVATGWPSPSAAGEGAGEAAPQVESPEADPQAAALVQAARERLSKWQSIQANVVQRVNVGDRRFEARGRLVVGEFPRLRLEYEVTVGQTIGRLLEVCDGQVLHVERRIEDGGSATRPGETDAEDGRDAAKPVIEATRRDVQRLLRATTEAGEVAVSMQAADIGLGGLSALLASLDRTMIFDSIREEEHEGRTFHVVQGVWDAGRLAELQQKLGGMAPQLATFLPERVRISFEAESLFPVRILYLKRTSDERRTYRAMLSLEFHDVEFDAPLPVDSFVYRAPTGVQQKDDTDDYIQLLKASQGQAPPAVSPVATDPATLNPRRPTESLPRAK